MSGRKQRLGRPRLFGFPRRSEAAGERFTWKQKLVFVVTAGGKGLITEMWRAGYFLFQSSASDFSSVLLQAKFFF